MKNYSIWLENMDFNPNPKLDKDIRVDVLIIGGGITGLSTMYHLKDSNLRVALVEKNLIGHGITARTTGKLTFLQETIYTDLVKIYNLSTAKLYLESQKEAINTVKNIVATNNIKCDLEDCQSFIYTKNSKDILKIEKEEQILESLNIKTENYNKLPDNTIIKYGISVNDTAVFHPLKYLNALKNLCQNDHMKIYENTKVLSINIKDNTYICQTDEYKILAKKVVLALHYPYFLFPYLFPFKSHLEKSYIAAYQVKDNLKFSAITVKTPTTSVRFAKLNKQNFKLYLNGSHNLAFKNNDPQNFNNLTLETPKPTYLWSNKDIITSDKLPLIGQINENLYLATGYNTWGMTNGSIAGVIISDLVLNKENKYTMLFNPLRGINKNSLISFPINIFSSVKSFVASKINKNKTWYHSNIKFNKKNGHNIATYTDELGKEHTVYNTCPHLKCSLIFNEIEKTWDCPCHGSRFDIDGKSIEGPSNFDITFKD